MSLGQVWQKRKVLVSEQLQRRELAPSRTRSRDRFAGRRVAVEALEDRFALVANFVINDPPAIVEGNTGTSTLNFTVTRTGDAADTQEGAMVSFRVLGVGSTVGLGAGTDIAHEGQGTIAFAPGQLAAQVAIPINGDTTVEANEQFVVQLTQLHGQEPVFSGSGSLITGLIGSAARGVAYGDFDNDGQTDVIMSDSAGNVNLFLNTTTTNGGVPVFDTINLPAPNPIIIANSNLGRIDVGDFNNDGNLDAVVVDSNINGFYTLRGNGAGGFTILQFVGTQTYSNISVADLDIEGFVDVVGSNNNGVFWGLGVIPIATQNVTDHVLVALDGDGRLDVAFTTASGVFTIRNTSTRAGGFSFDPPQQVGVGTGTALNSIVAGDFDSDGIVDLAVLDGVVGNNRIVILSNRGSNVFTPTFLPQRIADTAAKWTELTAADFNGDRQLDLAYIDTQDGVIPPNRTTQIHTLANTTVLNSSINPAIPGPREIRFNRDSQVIGSFFSNQLLAVDLNDDDRPELLTANLRTLPSEGQVSVFLNQVVNTARVSQVQLTPALPALAVATTEAELADFNGDGRLDIVSIDFATATLNVHLNMTPPGAMVNSFATAISVAGLTGFLIDVKVGDFDKNGRLDLAVLEAGVGVSFFLDTAATGAPTFAAPVLVANTVVVDPRGRLVVADVNGDNFDDLAFTVPSLGLRVLINNKAANFNAPLPFAPTTAGAESTALIAGNFNGSGFIDLAVTNPNTNTVEIFSNLTAGVFTRNVVVIPTANVIYQPVNLAAGDFNLDGITDIVVANQNSAKITLIAGNQNDIYIVTSTTNTRSQPFDLISFDYDNDGAMDLAYLQAQSNNITILQNTRSAADPVFVEVANVNLDTIPTTLAAGDLNLDGTDDLVTGSTILANQIRILQNLGVDLFTDPVGIGTIVNDDGTPSINTAPRLIAAIPPVTVSSTATTSTVDLRNFFADTETPSAQLMYAVTVTTDSNPSLFSALPTITNGLLTMNFAGAVQGTAELTIRARDAGNLDVFTTLRVTRNLVATAGDVTTGFTGGVLTISGNEQANHIEIVQDGLDLVVRGKANAAGVLSTIDGATEKRFLLAGMTALNVNMGAGNDQVQMHSLVFDGTTTIALGTGDDRATIGFDIPLDTALPPADNTILTGALIINGDNGDDQITIGRVTGNADTTLTGAAGVDTFKLRFSEFGTLNINGQAGADTITMTQNRIAGIASILSEDGNDLYNIGSNTFATHVTINAGAGQDGITFDNNTVNGSLALATGDLNTDTSTNSLVMGRNIVVGTAVITLGAAGDTALFGMYYTSTGGLAVAGNILGNTLIQLGTGNDNVSMSASRVENLVVYTGGGADLFAMYGNYILYYLAFVDADGGDSLPSVNGLNPAQV